MFDSISTNKITVPVNFLSQITSTNLVLEDAAPIAEN